MKRLKCPGTDNDSSVISNIIRGLQPHYPICQHISILLSHHPATINDLHQTMEAPYADLMLKTPDTTTLEQNRNGLYFCEFQKRWVNHPLGDVGPWKWLVREHLPDAHEMRRT